MASTPSNVAELNTIPSKDECEHMLGVIRESNFVAVKCDLGTFDEENLETILRVHKLQETARCITKESEWLDRMVISPVNEVPIPSPKLMDEYKHLLSENTNNTIIRAGSKVIADDLSRVVCDGWVSMNFISEISHLINKENQPTAVLVLNEIQSLPSAKRQALIRSIKGKPKHLFFALSVLQKSGAVHLSSTTLKGTHWTLLHIDVDKNIWTYCDTLGWNIPIDLKFNVVPVLDVIREEKDIFLKPKNIVRSAHHGSENDGTMHSCHTLCLQNYPLQACSNICGVATAIMMAIGALDPLVWKSFLSSKAEDLPNSLHWLKSPSHYSDFLRKTLVVWFVEKRVDLRYLGISKVSVVKVKNENLERKAPKIDKNFNFKPITQPRVVMKKRTIKSLCLGNMLSQDHTIEEDGICDAFVDIDSSDTVKEQEVEKNEAVDKSLCLGNILSQDHTIEEDGICDALVAKDSSDTVKEQEVEKNEAADIDVSINEDKTATMGTNNTTDLSFTIGKTFSSLGSLEILIKQYEEEQFVQLYKRRTRGLDSYAKKCGPDKKLNRDLKYAEVEYSCIHGGKCFKSKSTGKRPNGK